MKKKSLTTDEQKQLREHETTIGLYVLGFLAVGKALTAISDQKLYRQDYRDFESYISERWDMKLSHAYRLMDAASVIDDLSPIGEVLPVNEAQCRPLAPLPTEQRHEVWECVLAATQGGRITAALVADAVESYLEGIGGAKAKPAKSEDVFSRIGEIKKKLEKMRSKPEYARFCKQIEARIKKVVDQVEATYAAAMKDYLEGNAA